MGCFSGYIERQLQTKYYMVSILIKKFIYTIYFTVQISNISSFLYGPSIFVYVTSRPALYLLLPDLIFMNTQTNLTSDTHLYSAQSSRPSTIFDVTSMEITQNCLNSSSPCRKSGGQTVSNLSEIFRVILHHRPCQLTLSLILLHR